MVKLAANLTMLFQHLPFLDRIDAAAAAGFRAVECVAPYLVPEQELAERLARFDMKLALFNMPMGDQAGGERGMASNPERRQAFRDSIDLTLRYARATGAPIVHLMAGKIPDDADRRLWTETLVDNVRRAADMLGEHGVAVALEPVNTKVDNPGYFYGTTSEAIEIIDAVARENVKLQYDIYHMQIMEGDLARSIERLLSRIGHMQLADNPGRHEPGTGEINFPWLFAHIDAIEYQGWIGCEYHPLGDTIEGLGWAAPHLR